MTNDNDIENQILNLAGYYTSAWLETMACFVGTSKPEDIKTRNKMLLSVRDAELAKIDAIERLLGITPTTSEIRKWFKQEKRGNDYDTWIRERS
jgi:hypothetical protein